MTQAHPIDSIRCGHTRDEVPNSRAFHMHAHDSYELLLFLSGCGDYLVESTGYPLRPGCALLMRPGEVHCLRVNAAEPYERMVLHFRREAAEEWLLAPFEQRPLGIGNLFTADEIDPAFVRGCMERLITNAPPDRLNAVLLPALLAEFCRAFARRTTTPPVSTGDHSRIRDILDYVNDHLADDLSLDGLCARFFISRAQLGRLFRASTGSTVWEYVLVKRLIEARRRILGGTPALEAAHACGFQDYSAFYRAYKKRYHLSPTDDRRRLSERS